MNRIANKLHHWFISNKINAPVFQYLRDKTASIADNDENVMLFDAFANELAEVNAISVDDCNAYATIYSCAPIILSKALRSDINSKTSQHLCKYAFANKSKYNFSSKNEWTRLILDFLADNNGIIKAAYPNNMGVEGSGSQQPQYDVDKWVETMRYIYDTANTNNMPLDSITQHVISKWNDAEKEHFKYWMRYYQEGNASRYNVKTAQWITNPQPDEPRNMFTPVVKPDPLVEKRKRLDDARKKLRGRLKSVVELCDKYRDVLPRDVSDALRKAINDLNERVWHLELKASIVDSIIRTSNQFVKRGFVEGADELKKIAQEVATDKVPTPKKEKEIDEIERAVSPTAIDLKKETTPVKPEQFGNSRDTPREGVAANPEENSITFDTGTIDVPDLSSATFRDALVILERVSEVLSGKSVIRALSAADIVLANIGISSHFPELGESQAKLLEAFQYSSTRISDIISQLRAGLGSVMENKEKEEAEKQNDEVVETAEDLARPVGEVENALPVKQPIPQVKPQ